MSTALHPATVDDCDAFPAIERDAGASFAAFPHLAWISDAPVRDADAWRELVVEGGSLVAQREGDLVGFLVTARHGDHVHVEELSVLRAHHRQGIGTAMLLAAIEQARADGAEAMALTTFREVPWNAPFYARHGFRVIPDEDAPEHVRAARDHERQVGLADADRCAMVLTL